MDENKNYSKIIIFLLVISLIFNYYSFSRIGHLQDQVQNIENSFRWDIENTRSQIYHLTSQLAEQKEAEKWIIKEEFIPNYAYSNQDEIHLDLQWTFREVETDAIVTLFYRQKNHTDWNEVKAKNPAGTTYLAPIILTTTNDYEYQIIAEKSTIKTGEIKEVPARMYKPMPVVPIGSGYSEDGSGRIFHYSSNIAYIEPPLFEFFKMKHAFMEVYNGEILIDKQPYVREPYGGGDEYQSWTAQSDYRDETVTSIRLVVEYNNGTIHEGQIWPDDEFHFMYSEWGY
jgi:hypothetical protein